MGFSFRIGALLRALLRLERKTSIIRIDPEKFVECTSKVESIWSWKQLRRRKFVVHFHNGKFEIKELR